MKIAELSFAAMILAACAPAPAPDASVPPAPEPLPVAPPPAPASEAPPPEPAVPASPEVTDTLETSAGPVTITPIQHGTLAIGFDGKTIVVDPWSESPEGWLPKADLVLITDIHPDHYDPAGVEAVRKEGTVFVAPKVVADKLPEAKVLANGKETTALGVKIRAVAMYNEKRGPEEGKLFHDKGRGNGYLLGFGDKKIYLSGDTECIPEMKALAGIDLAFVCMNLPYTMPPEEAAACVNAFKPKAVIPYHYRGSDLEVFEKAIDPEAGVEVRRRDFYVGAETK